MVEAEDYVVVEGHVEEGTDGVEAVMMEELDIITLIYIRPINWAALMITIYPKQKYMVDQTIAY